MPLYEVVNKIGSDKLKLGNSTICGVTEAEYYLLKLMSNELFECWCNGRKLTLSADGTELLLIGELHSPFKDYKLVDVMDFVKERIEVGKEFNVHPKYLKLYDFYGNERLVLRSEHMH